MVYLLLLGQGLEMVGLSGCLPCVAEMYAFPRSSGQGKAGSPFLLCCSSSLAVTDWFAFFLISFQSSLVVSFIISRIYSA